LPIFGAALRQLEPMIGPFRVAMPTVETVADAVTAGVSDWPGRPIVLRGAAAKYDAFAASSAAMAASGTVALELALARVPMVIGYRLNRMTQIVLDWVVKVRQVNLVNLILGRILVTELLGDDCTPERLAVAVAELVRDEAVRSTHIAGYDEAMRRLGVGSLSPSRNAADRILAIIAARQRGEPVS
jgi:lipid-A-disaccharide synthase